MDYLISYADVIPSNAETTYRDWQAISETMSVKLPIRVINSGNPI